MEECHNSNECDLHDWVWKNLPGQDCTGCRVAKTIKGHVTE